MAYQPYNVQPSYPPSRGPPSPYYQQDSYGHEPGFAPQDSIADYYADDSQVSLHKSPSHLTPYDHPYSTGGGYGSTSDYFTEKVTPGAPPMPGQMYSPGALSFSGSQGSYGHVQQQMMQRRQRQQVVLQDGHLVLDCQVPQSILSMAKDYSGHTEEFTKMRYTAVTHDANDFNKERYKLRQTLYGRKTELAIVATMYNEDDELFENTMTSIYKNIEHFQSRDRSSTWGPKSWEKIVVCIVADGRQKVHKRVLNFLGLMGAYQDGIAKDEVLGQDVHAHMYEYTSQVHVGKNGSVSGGIVPIQICFILKEQNKKKLNSHRWFFNAVCAQLNPNVVALIDVGTRPSGTSLYHLWKEFDKHKNIGGACGEIAVDLGRGCVNVVNPLVATQNFEYKMSNILDKPLESVFGFISVLPGAFSAYRWKALQGKPLENYFLGEKMHEPGYTGSAFEANMYLAEDRILCFEISVKKNANWILKYCKSAKAYTDVPPTVAEFISQRRRWLNGSFFAAFHSTLHFWQIYTSGHNIFRMLWLQLEFIYNLVQMIFTWLAPGNFYLLSFFYILQAALGPDSREPLGKYSNEIFQLASAGWICLLFIILICSLGNRPQGARIQYFTVICLFALLFCLGLFCAGFTVYSNVPHTAEGWTDWEALVSNESFINIVVSLGATYGLYLVTSLLHFEPWHLFTSLIQYMLLLPATVNILSIYSFSNIHDVSWGTKGGGAHKDLGAAKKTSKDGQEAVEVEIPTAPKDIDRLWQGMRSELSRPLQEEKSKRGADEKQSDYMATFRTNVLLAYLGTNLALVYVFTSSFFLNALRSELDTAQNINPYLVVIFWSVAALSAVRAFGSIAYLVLRLVGQ